MFPAVLACLKTEVEKYTRALMPANCKQPEEEGIQAFRYYHLGTPTQLSGPDRGAHKVDRWMPGRFAFWELAQAACDLRKVQSLRIGCKQDQYCLPHVQGV
eukprot:725586-Pelagomonas_calceolata.AAC.6